MCALHPGHFRWDRTRARSRARFARPLHRRPKVAAVQVALKRIGLYNATVDGVRGPMTKSAIVRFQRRRGLAVDGVVGPQTRRAFGKRGRPAFGSRTMKRGDRGWDVAAMQYILARARLPARGDRCRLRPDDRHGAQELPARLWALRRRPGRPVDDLGATPRIANEGHDARGERPGAVAAAVPGPIGDRFGAPRKGRRTHTGIDFPVQAGTQVGAAGVGVTEFAGWNSGGYGNLVVVRHGLGYTTWYAHLSVITTYVGERVRGGTRLGYVGSTGHSTGPHLHLELRKNAVPVDPVRVSAAGGGNAGERERWRRGRDRVPDPQAARQVHARPA